jgi:hypothetical protein
MPADTPNEGTPKHLAVQMLKRIYSDLDNKDMPEDQFVRESLGALQESKDRKKSGLILPND